MRAIIVCYSIDIVYLIANVLQSHVYHTCHVYLLNLYFKKYVKHKSAPQGKILRLRATNAALRLAERLM